MPTWSSGSCPLCGSRAHFTAGALGVPAPAPAIPPPPGSRILVCRECFLVFVDPLPQWTAADFDTLYGQGYFAPLPEWWQRIRAEREPARRFRVLEPHLRTPVRSMLEVGAGVSAFMARYLGARGWEAVAQEPSAASRRDLLTQAPGLELTGTPFLELDGARQFALIYADSVLEHVWNPLDYFARARELLLPGGVLFFVAPNELSAVNLALTARGRLTTGAARALCPYSESYHLIGYTHRAVATACRRVGLELVAFHRGHDWRWRSELEGDRPAWLRYPLALGHALADAAGLGTNLEVALRRPATGESG